MPLFCLPSIVGDGMGLFEKTHLPDQNSSSLYCGPRLEQHNQGFLTDNIKIPPDKGGI
jgi:hypothetical protein